jgi:hypothetical protein
MSYRGKDWDLRRLQLIVYDLISGFPVYLRTFDKFLPFKRLGEIINHRLTKARLRELGSPAAARDDQTFLKHLYETLQSWGIGSRGSVLKPYPGFVSALQAKASEIAALGDVAIDQERIDAARVAPSQDRHVTDNFPKWHPFANKDDSVFVGLCLAKEFIQFLSPTFPRSYSVQTVFTVRPKHGLCFGRRAYARGGVGRSIVGVHLRSSRKRRKAAHISQPCQQQRVENG